MYKFLFMLSIFSIVSLFSVYIYAEYDRNKEESISKDILSSLSNLEENETDETTIDSYENALVVKITQDITGELESINNDGQQFEDQTSQIAKATSTYTAPNGKKYETVGIVKIPKINITYPILSKTTDALLKVAPCKFHGASPNEVGNLCIIAHNYKRKGVCNTGIKKKKEDV